MGKFDWSAHFEAESRRHRRADSLLPFAYVLWGIGGVSFLLSLLKLGPAWLASAAWVGVAGGFAIVLLAALIASGSLSSFVRDLDLGRDWQSIGSILLAAMALTAGIAGILIMSQKVGGWITGILVAMIVLGGLFIWQAPSYVRRVRRVREQVRTEVIEMALPEGKIVHIPVVFDEERIRRDLAKYMSSDTALQTYLAGLALRFKTEQHKRVVMKLIEYLGIRRDLYGVAYEARRAQNRLGRADIEEEVERKELELRRRKTELEIQQVGTLRVKELERDIARLEREIEELRRKPEPPPAPQEQETPEQYAARRADLLIKYAAEVKRIRDSVDDPELAEDLIDRFLVDIMKREDH